MRAFFYGWRRKVGCITLVMACVMTGMWMRSRVYGDFVRLNPSSSSNHFLASFQGHLKWIKSTDCTGSISPAPLYRFSMDERYPDDEILMPLFGGAGAHPWAWQWEGFGFLMGEAQWPPYVISTVQIPYWSVAIPLTLLSAILIVWPIRKRA